MSKSCRWFPWVFLDVSLIYVLKYIFRFCAHDIFCNLCFCNCLFPGYISCSWAAHFVNCKPSVCWGIFKTFFFADCWAYKEYFCMILPYRNVISFMWLFSWHFTISNSSTFGLERFCAVLKFIFCTSWWLKSKQSAPQIQMILRYCRRVSINSQLSFICTRVQFLILTCKRWIGVEISGMKIMKCNRKLYISIIMKIKRNLYLCFIHRELHAIFRFLQCLDGWLLRCQSNIMSLQEIYSGVFLTSVSHGKLGIFNQSWWNQIPLLVHIPIYLKLTIYPWACN